MLEELDALDPDVVPVGARRANPAIPDAARWVGTVLAALASGIALSQWLEPRIGHDAAKIVYAGWCVAGWVFASERWGHRRYRLERAARDVVRPLVMALGLALALLLIARLGVHLAGDARPRGGAKSGEALR